MCVLIQRFRGCCLNTVSSIAVFTLAEPVQQIVLGGEHEGSCEIWDGGKWLLEYCAPVAHISFDLRTLFISVILGVHYSWSFFIKLFPSG